MEQHDHLAWWEELPLALATIAQSIVVGQWYYHSIDLGLAWLNIAVAVIAGLALDAIVVTTVMGRRVGRDSYWSAGAAFGAFLCSALIALDTYSAWLVTVRPALHVAYPLMVLLYSQHLAAPRKRPPSTDTTDRLTPLEALPERLETIAEPGPVSYVAAPPALDEQASLTDPLEATVVVAQALSAYACPFCHAPLTSKQSLGAAVRNGHCPACKVVTNGHVRTS